MGNLRLVVCGRRWFAWQIRGCRMWHETCSSNSIRLTRLFRRPTMAPRLTRILVPTDFSETADAALAYAKDLATRLGASLHLVHVFTDPYAVAAVAPEVYAPVPPEARERALEEVRERLLERLDASEEQKFRGSRGVVRGLVARQIVDYAVNQDIDVIVMGTHGRRGVAHLLLGSVAEHVVRTAACPVLTVRAGHHAHEQAEKPAVTAA
jgi:nucleotide-binding universal stress UspA family protein